MKKETNQATTVIEDIICDICGESVIPNVLKKHLKNANDFSDYAKLTASFGYGSKRDGERFDFDFCESCFEKIRAKVRELQGK
ncbi:MULTISPECIES: hypothetical protein [Aliidiomarina]|uniref:Uncharacterized protein n=2 Tax=Aliidiomarina TaxID=1249554 RepID=A0A432WPK5_9GAMM|nr:MULTISPECIES: hypothetical protein [Aliidiomarina]RUO35705.1 hypothetical protein CWE11_02800 [Aliidiomarina sanyensis]RUO42662.1 hypothetical protein CWE15_04415 [Aliidiomarina taiwanensis]